MKCGDLNKILEITILSQTADKPDKRRQRLNILVKVLNKKSH